MPRSWANYILKFNRSQLQKRKIRKLKDMLQNGLQENGINFKKVSNAELKIIKNRIRVQAKKDTRKTLVLYGISITLSLLLLWFFYNLIM